MNWRTANWNTANWHSGNRDTANWHSGNRDTANGHSANRHSAKMARDKALHSKLECHNTFICQFSDASHLFLTNSSSRRLSYVSFVAWYPVSVDVNRGCRSDSFGKYVCLLLFLCTGGKRENIYSDFPRLSPASLFSFLYPRSSSQSVPSHPNPSRNFSPTPFSL